MSNFNKPLDDLLVFIDAQVVIMSYLHTDFVSSNFHLMGNYTKRIAKILQSVFMYISHTSLPLVLNV